MHKVIEILFFCSVGATVIVLGLGLGTMFSKSSTRLASSNRLMRLRVMLQGLSIILFLLLISSK
ncbi:MAG: HIG1 domain-containing protein [Proteobacteria bacterium]|nr:HIG1 domain-containing protein [Pseudomonadota bacterium]